LTGGAMAAGGGVFIEIDELEFVDRGRKSLE
jgi:hypothetical protein